jgi:bifunctional DNA-binding transcriptional regulator/antitoxin component of YhaV-PrlF toxin-antitoxin module
VKTDTATITSQGQMTVPKRWREQADAVYLGALTMAELRDGVSIAPAGKQARLDAFVGRL